MRQPRCYVIAHDTSLVVNECVQSLRLHGWDYEIFPAIDGHIITQADWQRTGVAMSDQGKMPRRPGAQGCWLSHFALWKKCSQSSNAMVILEHDVLIQSPWPEELDIDKKLIKLYRSAETKVNPVFGTWSKGSHAYTLTPAQAEMLITHAQHKGAQAVDKHLGDAVLPWSFYKHDLVTLNPRRGPSITSPLRRH